MRFENTTVNLNFYIEELYEYMPEYKILIDFIYSIGGVI
jgi:hypothetical protein